MKRRNDIILEQHRSNTKKGTFADGLMMMSMRESLIIKGLILTKRYKEILRILIAEDKERTCDIKYEYEYERTMKSFQWIENMIDNKKIRNKPIERDTAKFVHYWISDKKYHWLQSDDENNIQGALQWLTNNINKQYSIFELAN